MSAYPGKGDVYEKIRTILRGTSDGDTLRPWQLKLVEDATNGFLNEQGWQLFEVLLRAVIENTYRCYSTIDLMVAKLNDPSLPPPTPALHGVEHLDYDNGGFIYWKGIMVEHYDHPLSPKMREDAIELGERCRHLEAIGVPVSWGAAIWYWDWFKDLTADHPYKAVMALCPALYQHKDGIAAAIVLKTVAYAYDGETWVRHVRKRSFDPWICDVWDYRVQLHESQPNLQTLEVRGFEIADCGQKDKLGPCFASTAGVTAWLEKYNAPTELDVPRRSKKAASGYPTLASEGAS